MQDSIVETVNASINKIDIILVLMDCFPLWLYPKFFQTLPVGLVELKE